VASVLIDLVHVWLFIQKKAFTPRKIWKVIWEETDFKKLSGNRDAWKGTLFLFHTLEFNVILLILSHFYPVLFYVSIGLFYNIILDLVHHYYWDLPLDWVSLVIFIGKQTGYSRRRKKKVGFFLVLR
jgi:hypothetical protein